VQERERFRCAAKITFSEYIRWFKTKQKKVSRYSVDQTVFESIQGMQELV